MPVSELRELGTTRYVGDRSTMVAHDSWHPESEGCVLDEVLTRGDAVCFDPDTLDGALWEGYEYCEACHDKTDPARPDSTENTDAAERDAGERGSPPSALRRIDPEENRSESKRQVAEVIG